MFNLKVEMSSEPIIEHSLLDVTGRVELEAYPVFSPVKVDFVGYMTHLGAVDKPVTFEGPGKNKKCLFGFLFFILTFARAIC